MIGISVLNYNDSVRIVELVNNCLKDGCFDYIVVVDNSSNKEQKDYLKKNLDSSIILLENNENLGFGKGTNVGIKYLVEVLNVDKVFISNSDIIFTKEIVLKCIEKLENKYYAAVTTMNYEFDGSTGVTYWDFPKFSYYIKWMFYLYRRKHPACLSKKSNKDFFEADVLRGSFVGFNAQALKKVNYFDEDTFIYFEENCIFRKLNKIGYKAGVINHVYYIHNHNHKKGLINPNLLRWNHQSAYYYFSKYENINIFKKIIFILCSKISIFEIYLTNFLKRILKK